MSYKKHPPKAPHFDEQGRVAFEHIHALIGNKAWNAWGFGKDKGNGLEWGLLRDKLGLERDYKPIILDAEKLANAGDYQILKDDVHAVTFWRSDKRPRKRPFISTSNAQQGEKNLFCG